MTTVIRKDILNVLQRDWATYVQRFHTLSAVAQSVFLVKQGYTRFADLLSHIIAWWEVGYHTIDKYLTDPRHESQAFDVDAFNAEAVAKVSELEEQSVISSFEEMRSFLVEYVNELPDSAFDNEKVVKQFNMEFIGHLDDHKIPEGE
jgi:DNA-dependent RNA polymerase auxiliary subunit epsilon